MPLLEEFYVGERYTVFLTEDGKEGWDNLTETYCFIP